MQRSNWKLLGKQDQPNWQADHDKQLETYRKKPKIIIMATIENITLESHATSCKTIFFMKKQIWRKKSIRVKSTVKIQNRKKSKKQKKNWTRHKRHWGCWMKTQLTKTEKITCSFHFHLNLIVLEKGTTRSFLKKYFIFNLHKFRKHIWRYKTFEI